MQMFLKCVLLGRFAISVQNWSIIDLTELYLVKCVKVFYQPVVYIAWDRKKVLFNQCGKVNGRF